MHEPARLFGTPLSNYYNKVKIALIELERPFTEVLHLPGEQWPDKGSPSGKIPFLETADGFIYESQAIVEYLEDTTPDHSCYPSSATEKARCRELTQTIELYIELPARRLYPAAFWGRPFQQNLADEVLQEVSHGLRILGRRALFSPWIGGNNFTHADAAAWAHLTTVSNTLRALKQPDVLSEVLPNIRNYLKHVLTRPSIKRADNDLRQAWHNRNQNTTS